MADGVFSALDMFFVLSGFLITAILVGSLSRFGVGFFPAFYASRVRRLVPMAVVVLALTVVGTYLAYSGARAQLVATDALWAFFFAVNWHFMREGTDYFALHTASPLQHYWSLSVEEQFYVVWPLLVLVAVVLARRVRTERAAMAVIAGILGAVTLASFAYSMWHSAANPVASYFSTFDRAWEFGAGGLLALASNRLARLPRAVKVACSWVGVAAILTTIFVLDTTYAFPAPWGLVPVAATALVIVGGLDTGTRHQVVLHNPVMIWLGNLSYSIYLWHMPVQVILVPYFGDTTIAYYVTSLSVTLGLSVIGYHTIEKPLRKARFLMTRAERTRFAPAPLFEPRVGRVLRATQGYVVIGGLLALIYVGLVVARSGVLAPPAAADPPAAEVVAQQARLTQALAVESFPPAFTPGLEQMAGSTWEAEHADVSCIDVDPADLAACRFGDADAERTVAVVGDSFAVAWMPAVLDAFTPRGWAVQQLTLTQCPTWTLPSYVKRDESDFPECGAMHDAVTQYVATEKPDLLVVSSAYDQVLNTQQPGIGGTGEDLARTGLGATLANVVTPDTRVVVLQPPPPHQSLIDCVSRAGRPRDCTSEPSEFWYEHVAGEQAAAAAGGADYVPTLDWFCVEDRCPGFVGTTPVTVEGTHLTVEYARQLSALLAGSFTELAAADAREDQLPDEVTDDLSESGGP